MICIPIIAKDTSEALEKIERANEMADLLEIRLDLMEAFCIKDMVRVASRPVIVTYRSKKEGGKGSADYGTRIRYLWDAIEAGADYVDLEYSMPLDFRSRFSRMQGPFKVIISVHLLYRTPTGEELKDIFKGMAATGADVVKIITRARTVEDNLRVLNLIPLAQGLGVRIITFCMGPMGRISRIASPLMGGYLTFASLEKGEESADGQITVREMKKVMDIIKL